MIELIDYYIILFFIALIVLIGVIYLIHKEFKHQLKEIRKFDYIYHGIIDVKDLKLERIYEIE